MATMRRHPPDLLILIATLFLVGIGIVAVGSAGTPQALQLTDGRNPFLFGARQLVFAVMGIIVMFYMSRRDFHKMRKFTLGFALVTIILLIVVLAFKDVKGAHRWIKFGFISLQPSELAKISVILFIAHYLSEIGNGVKKLWQGVIIPLVYTSIVGGLIMLEPDFGTTLSVFMIFFAMLFAAGMRMIHFSLMGALAVVAAIVAIKMEPYRLRRLGNPMNDPKGAGWQIVNSIMALGSGGLFGLGFGRSRQKFFYLPEAHTDYIFAIIGEETGLLGTLTVLALFLLLAWRGYRAAMTASDDYGCLLAIGITSYIVFQALLNMAVVTAMLPTTGITLPLVSNGGTSLCITLFSLGILLNISKGGEVTRQ
ncbi:MAG TPA: putative lipid II flippase FtsW [Bacillota bacterium]|nr:putative lipid II flippase FtsW [Bacillota bacterium]